MAGRISEMAAASGLTDDDLLEITNDPLGTPASQKLTALQMSTYIDGKLVPYKAGGTDVAVADGGTGASTASAARTNLGLAIGTDVQAYDAQLADIAGITFAQGDILYFNGTNVVKLAAGTSGHYLKTQGAGANPTWAAVSGGGSLDPGSLLISSERFI